MVDPTTPSRPTSTISTAETATSKPSTSSSSSTSASSRLMPTLNRLSMSTSRPTDLLSPPDEAEIDLDPAAGYKSKTIRFVSKGGKEVFRRSGLAGLFPASSGSVAPSAGPSSPTGSKAKSKSTLGLDTSKILYPTLQQHPPPLPHPVLVVSLAQISGISPMINNDELFDTLMRKLEPWVGEEGEGGYVLVVLAADDGASHDGARKWPGVGWWVWKWKRIPRKYRKNMKRLYIVHPSLFTRTLLPFLIPLLSPKSYGKLHPLSSLLALSHTYGVPLSGIDITLPVLQQEAMLLRDRPDLVPSRCRSGSQRPKMEERASWTGTISSSISYATSYLPFSQYLTDNNEKSTDNGTEPRGLWGRSAEDVLQSSGGKLPRTLTGLRDAILTHCTSTEGVFRRTSNSTLLGPITALLDLPIADQPNLPWSDIAMEDPLVPPKVLLRFLADLAEPLIPESGYASIRQTTTPEDLPARFIPSLPTSTHTILAFVVQIMAELVKHEAATKMTPLAFAIVLAPALITGSNPLEDAELCMEPGKKLPKGLGGDQKRAASDASEGGGGTLVGVLRMWIEAGAGQGAAP